MCRSIYEFILYNIKIESYIHVLINVIHLRVQVGAATCNSHNSGDNYCQNIHSLIVEKVHSASLSSIKQ